MNRNGSVHKTVHCIRWINLCWDMDQITNMWGLNLPRFAWRNWNSASLWMHVTNSGRSIQSRWTTYYITKPTFDISVIHQLLTAAAKPRPLQFSTA